MIKITPVGSDYSSFAAPKTKKSSAQTSFGELLDKQVEKNTKKEYVPLPGTSGYAEYSSGKGGISPLDGKYYQRNDSSNMQYYEVPSEPTFYTLKRTFENNTFTQYWFTHPAGNKIGNELKEILTPKEYDLALVATAEADYDDLTQEVAELLRDLEHELVATNIKPIPMEEREWYKNPEAAALKWVGKPPVANESIYLPLEDRDLTTYSPREDFLRIVIEAKYDLKEFMNVATNLEGEDRALVLDYLAGNGDWSQLRYHLNEISELTPKEAVEYVVDTRKNVLVPLKPGATSSLVPNREIKDASEHPNYIAPHPNYHPNYHKNWI